MKNYINNILIISLILLIGCQGSLSKKPPIHLNPNMDSVERYDPQSESAFFADKMTMRTPVEGTIARGELRADSKFYEGKDKNDNFIASIPFDVQVHDIERGQERYDIFCAPCHSEIGYGDGIVTQYGYPLSASMHLERVINMLDGKLYDIISNGSAIMPSYAHQIPVKDRWAIVAYVRALQLNEKNKLTTLQSDNNKDMN
jgi:hypothetical protein